MYWIGLLVVSLFVGCFFLLGLWTAYHKNLMTLEGDLISANQNLGLIVGILSLVATEVGSVFINGTAEEAFQRGALWCLAPIGYSLSMSLNGAFFISSLRANKFVTSIDVLQSAFGPSLGALIYMPSCIGDILWNGAVLSGMAKSLSYVLQVNETIAIVVGSTITITYTLLGGMYSVAYTDVLQFIFIFIGLFLSLPFVFLNDTVIKTVLPTLTLSSWTGILSIENVGTYIDTFLCVLFGGIPWQAYYQRTLASSSTRASQWMSYTASVLCLLLMIPPVLLGVIAKNSEEVLKILSTHDEDSSNVLSVTVSIFTPSSISLIVLCAISAASMSSMDSALLAGSTYLTHNIYGALLRPKSGKVERVAVFRVFVLVLGALSTLLAFITPSIYGFWVLAGDLGYIIVFPQFVSAVFWSEKVNSFGCLVSTTTALVLRILIGEPLLKLPSLVSFTASHLLPLKTLIMIISLGILVSVSFCTKRDRDSDVTS